MQAPLRQLVTHLKEREGDKAFMLDVISTLMQGNHPYFSKDYVPPKRISAAMPEVNIDNSDNFFTGLPPTKYNGKSKSRHLSLFISEKERANLKLIRL
jgi:hypothetical protein